MVEKVVVIRPGALGDVLAVRGAVCWLKKRFPGHSVELIAPGERGALLRHPGWADRTWDWEGAAFSWLFSDGAALPPEMLGQVFAGTRLVVAYMNFPGSDSESAFFNRLRRVAPDAGIFIYLSAPPPNSGKNIVGWLCEQAGAAAGDSGGLYADSGNCQTARLPQEAEDCNSIPHRRYAVLHPGSGSERKNWPVENFIVLGRRLCGLGMDVVVTSGEADGERGVALAAAIPGAQSIWQPKLSSLAKVLAHATLYIGNDSGVSHLAASVRTVAGGFPVAAVVFGPTESAVWAPPGAFVMHAGGDMRGLDADKAWAQMLEAFPVLLQRISE